jgi:hypothetical protein
LELLSDRCGWRLILQDGYVQLIQIDFRLGLFLADASGDAKLFIGSPCRLKGQDCDVLLIPGESSSLAPALRLFNAKVTGLSVQLTGHLKVQFGDGRLIEVNPDDAYEAWELGCSIGFLMVCCPDGHVSYFSERTVPKPP